MTDQEVVESEKQKRGYDEVDSTTSFTSNQPPKKGKMLDEDLQESIFSLIDSKCEPLLAKIEELENDNRAIHGKFVFLEKENYFLQNRLEHLEIDLEDLKQYSRKTNIRLFNVREFPNENTDKIIQDICRIHLNIQILDWQISNSHRLGEPTQNHRRRPIICQFSSSRVQSQVVNAVKQHRQRLKDALITIAEDLTPARARLVTQGRSFVRDGRLLGAWSDRGRVKVRRNDRTVTVIKREADLMVAQMQATNDQNQNVTQQSVNVQNHNAPSSTPPQTQQPPTQTIPTTAATVTCSQQNRPTMTKTYSAVLRTSTPCTQPSKVFGRGGSNALNSDYQVVDLSQHPLPPFTPRPGMNNNISMQHPPPLSPFTPTVTWAVGSSQQQQLQPIMPGQGVNIYQQPPPPFSLPGTIVSSSVQGAYNQRPLPSLPPSVGASGIIADARLHYRPPLQPVITTAHGHSNVSTLRHPLPPPSGSPVLGAVGGAHTPVMQQYFP